MQLLKYALDCMKNDETERIKAGALHDLLLQQLESSKLFCKYI